ncbi:hypothetical protein A4A58_03570 [Tardiphaga robiniae]|uniref:Uncharacterized protein n=1 Tax=Tardiphaga robiniae TaxID=943830 RepID=A0A161QV77_9BRAD|nr:hypothetical protein A4A58_03570 [Tardiphaga robiniae]
MNDGAYLAPFIAFAAVNTWIHCGRPGSRELPRDLADEFCVYADLAGWQNEPYLAGLLSGLEHPGWHPKSATFKIDANPYRIEVNRNSFDNGRIFAKTDAGQRYRAYVADCRKDAAAFSSHLRIP